MKKLWPVLVVILVVVAYYHTLKWHEEPIYEYIAPEDIFQIVKRYDAYNYQFHHIHNENGNIRWEDFHAKFCSDYEPQLSAGLTIIWLRYYDEGKCWYIKSKEYGYKFLRDEHGEPTLAPNCHANLVKDIYECSPIADEAIF